jgi:hypothetical protein
MWVSDYQWGWAAFHYGNWYYDPFYGWLWVPGTQWAPAWVVWSSAPGYYGWAPIGPRINVNVVINGGYRVPDNYWVFVPSRYIASPEISHYYGPRSNNTVLIQKSTIINNTYVDNSTHITYVKGPDRNEVQKVTGRNVEAVAVKNMDRPGQDVSKNEVSLYQPQVNKEAAGATHAAPKKVVELKDVKTEQERKQTQEKRETQPKAATPSKDQVQPKQPQQQKEAPKKEPQPKQQDPNPKTMNQPAQRQNDYALKQKNSINQERQVVASKQNATTIKNQTNRNVAVTETAKNQQQIVKQSQDEKTGTAQQNNTVAYSKSKAQVEKIHPVTAEQKPETMNQAQTRKQPEEMRKRSLKK